MEVAEASGSWQKGNGRGLECPLTISRIADSINNAHLGHDMGLQTHAGTGYGWGGYGYGLTSSYLPKTHTQGVGTAGF